MSWFPSPPFLLALCQQRRAGRQGRQKGRRRCACRAKGARSRGNCRARCRRGPPAVSRRHCPGRRSRVGQAGPCSAPCRPGGESEPSRRGGDSFTRLLRLRCFVFGFFPLVRFPSQWQTCPLLPASSSWRRSPRLHAPPLYPRRTKRTGRCRRWPTKAAPQSRRPAATPQHLPQRPRPSEGAFVD